MPAGPYAQANAIVDNTSVKGGAILRQVKPERIFVHPYSME